MFIPRKGRRPWSATFSLSGDEGWVDRTRKGTDDLKYHVVSKKTSTKKIKIKTTLFCN